MAHRSFGALADTVEAYTGNTNAGAALAHVQAGYERALLGIDPRDSHVHTWAFARPIGELAVTATVSGTATGVYDAGADETTITATAATFVPSHVGDTITVTGGGGPGIDLALVIASYTSSRIVVATGGQAFVAKPITLPHSGIYPLPNDFGGLLESPVYPYPAGVTTSRWREASPEEVFEAWRASKTQGTARLYALVPLPTARICEWGTATLVPTAGGATVEVPTGLATVESVLALYAEDPERADPLWSDGVVTAGAVTIQSADPAGNEAIWYLLAGVTGTAARQTWAIAVSPKPDSDRVLRYRYFVDPPDATDSFTAYPVGGPLMGPLYEAAALADAEAKLSRTPGRWETRFEQLMAGCIDRDRTLFETEGQEQLEDA
jgi:hypothetical protein